LIGLIKAPRLNPDMEEPPMDVQQPTSAVIIELIETETTTIDLRGNPHRSPPKPSDESLEIAAIARAIDAVGAIKQENHKRTTEEPWRRYAPAAGGWRGDRPHGDGDPNIQGVITDIATIAISIATLGGGTVFLKMSRDVLIQWLKNRAGRSITLKRGDTSVILHGINDVDAAIATMNELEKQRPRTTFPDAKGVEGKRAPRKSATQKPSH